MIAWPVIAGVALFMVLVMNAAWLVQRKVGNSGWIDVFWTYGTGLAGAAAALLPWAGQPSQRQGLVAAIVLIWALRLGTYVAVRVARSDEDARYAKFKRDWGGSYQRKIYWLIQPQALITAALCVSIMVAAHRDAPGIDARDLAGLAVLLVAIGGETLADRQLSAFKRGNAGKGAIIDTGLWAWSRHPNYFFEWFGWLAYPIIAFEPAQPLSWATLIAPLAMYGVLRFMTGVPPLEGSMLASRGEAFRAYQARTSVFFPLPPKTGA